MMLSQPRGEVSQVVQKLADAGKPGSSQGKGQAVGAAPARGGASHAGSFYGGHIANPLNKLVGPKTELSTSLAPSDFSLAWHLLSVGDTWPMESSRFLRLPCPENLW